MLRTYAQIIDDTSIILEDTGNAVFADATLDIHLKNALSFVAKYKPYQVKETRLLTASSRVVDVSGMPCLIDVVKAEYKLAQTPLAFRNVTRFGDEVTIGTTLLPAAGDKAYLYCEKSHTLVTAPSTLTGAVNLLAGYAAGATSIVLDGLGTGVIKAGTLVYFTGIAGEYQVTADVSIVANAATIIITPGLLEAVVDDTVVTFKCSTLTPDLERIIPDLVAGNAAINWMGDGRTQIKSAVTAIDLANTGVDNMTARLVAAITATGTAVTTLGSASARVTQAIADLTSGRVPLALVEDRVTQAQTDIASARTMITDTQTNLDTDLGNIAARITASLAALSSANSLIKTVTVGSTPVSQYYQKAMGELSNANQYISQSRVRLSEGNFAGVYAGLSRGEMSAGQIYRSQSEGYANFAARELQSANTYLGQASGYFHDTNAELQMASGYLQQASGYSREANSRLSIANVLAGYQRWGQAKVAEATRELKKLEKPKMFETYPES